MKIVLLTSDGLEHIFVANTLCEHIELAAIVVDRRRKRSPFHKFWAKIRKYGVLGAADRVALAIFKIIVRDSSVRREELVRVFGERKCTEFNRADLLVNVSGVNGQESLNALKNIEPDLLLVYGTGIVGERVRSTARQLVVNMHTGLSPYYRGASCAFWPLHNKELDRLGATVHECTAELDGGKIFGASKAQIDRLDSLHTVFGRTVLVGAELYVRVVKELIRGEFQDEQQDFSLGREYKASMRGLRAEIRTRWLIRKGLIRDFVDMKLSD